MATWRSPDLGTMASFPEGGYQLVSEHSIQPHQQMYCSSSQKLGHHQVLDELEVRQPPIYHQQHQLVTRSHDMFSFSAAPQYPGGGYASPEEDKVVNPYELKPQIFNQFSDEMARECDSSQRSFHHRAFDGVEMRQQQSYTDPFISAYYQQHYSQHSQHPCSDPHIIHFPQQPGEPNPWSLISQGYEVPREQAADQELNLRYKEHSDPMKEEEIYVSNFEFNPRSHHRPQTRLPFYMNQGSNSSRISPRVSTMPNCTGNSFAATQQTTHQDQYVSSRPIHQQTYQQPSATTVDPSRSNSDIFLEIVKKMESIQAEFKLLKVDLEVVDEEEDEGYDSQVVVEDEETNYEEEVECTGYEEEYRCTNYEEEYPPLIPNFPAKHFSGNYEDRGANREDETSFEVVKHEEEELCEDREFFENLENGYMDSLDKDTGYGKEYRCTNYEEEYPPLIPNFSAKHSSRNCEDEDEDEDLYFEDEDTYSDAEVECSEYDEDDGFTIQVEDKITLEPKSEITVDNHGAALEIQISDEDEVTETRSEENDLLIALDASRSTIASIDFQVSGLSELEIVRKNDHLVSVSVALSLSGKQDFAIVQHSNPAPNVNNKVSFGVDASMKSKDRGPWPTVQQSQTSQILKTPPRQPPKPPWAYSSSSFYRTPSVPTSERPLPKPPWKKKLHTSIYTNTWGSHQNPTQPEPKNFQGSDRSISSNSWKAWNLWFPIQRTWSTLMGISSNRW